VFQNQKMQRCHWKQCQRLALSAFQGKLGPRRQSLQRQARARRCPPTLQRLQGGREGQRRRHQRPAQGRPAPLHQAWEVYRPPFADGQCEGSADCELVGEAERHSEGLTDTVYCDEVLREGEPEGVEERQSVAEEESVAFLFCSEHAKKKNGKKKKKNLPVPRGPLGGIR
jgi:hypothetical protein